MKQDVLITLRGTQNYANDEPDTIELITGGIMQDRNGKFSLSYEETELTGTAGVTSTFFIPNEKRVVLTREGAIHSKMIFEVGVKDQSLYDLGFGALLVGIQAKEIRNELTPEGGRLVIDYLVEIEGSLHSHNTYEISVKPLASNN